MKKLITTILAILLAASAAHAGDWIDQGDGTWNMQPTELTGVTTAEKNKLELIRADHNYEYRDTGNALSASDWASGVLLGFTDRDGNLVEKWCAALWKAFKRKWVSPGDLAASSNYGDTEGLAVTVPPPPAP